MAINIVREVRNTDFWKIPTPAVVDPGTYDKNLAS